MSLGSAGAVVAVAIAALSGGWHTGRAYEGWAAPVEPALCRCLCEIGTQAGCPAPAAAPGPAPKVLDTKPWSSLGLLASWAAAVLQGLVLFVVGTISAAAAWCCRPAPAATRALEDAPRAAAPALPRDRPLAHLAVDAADL